MHFLRILTYTTLVILAACSVAPAEVAQPQADQIDRICSNVMNFAPGEAHFMGCQESLRRTVTKLNASQKLQDGIASCSAQGLQERTPAFATCVLEHSRNGELLTSYKEGR